MGHIFGKFALMYLLMPVIGLLLGVVMVLVARKNNLLSNKKAIFYFLLSILVLAVPALSGLIDYGFMPYFYTFLSVLYLVLGYFNLGILRKFVNGIEDKPYYIELLSVFFVMFAGAALFSVVFNLCNELQYGLWACTCLLTFIFPSVFLKTYRTYMDIPQEVYTLWAFDNENGTIEQYLDSKKIIVVELEIFKQVEDEKPLNIKAKASDNIPFGAWFKVFIIDYNKKSPARPIIYNDRDNSYGWMFYVNNFFGMKKHIDPSMSFAANRIKEKNMIMIKRVKCSEA